MNTSRSFILVAMTVAAYPAAVFAAEIDALVRGGVGVSDNVARLPALEVDETIATVGFDVSVAEETRRIEADIRANVDYFDYLDGTFEGEWVGGINGFARFTLVEEVFDWDIRNNFGQQLADPLSPSRPGNRENVNFLSTGPTLRLLASTRNAIVLDARYSRLDYEERPFDNDRMTGGISVQRDTSRNSTISLNLIGERTEFDNDGLTPPIDRREGFLRIETGGSVSTVSLDVGYNEVEFDGRVGDGFLARIDWTRQVSANSELRLSAGSRYSDQGNIFRLYQDITGDLRDTVDGANSPAPFQNDFAAVNYSLEADRYSISLSADFNMEDYQGRTGLNREVGRFSARFRRDLTRTVFASVDLRFLNRKFTDIDLSDDDLMFGVAFGYRFSPGFSASFDYRHSRRKSSQPGGDYTENRAFLRFNYVPVWSR